MPGSNPATTKQGILKPMRAEIEQQVDEIRESLTLLRRHL
jgi:hypothetical protein